MSTAKFPATNNKTQHIKTVKNEHGNHTQTRGRDRTVEEQALREEELRLMNADFAYSVGDNHYLYTTGGRERGKGGSAFSDLTQESYCCSITERGE